MRAARRFAERLRDEGGLERVARVKVELFGSLGFTGKGHGSDVAVMLGLEGEDPKTVDVDAVPTRVAAIGAAQTLRLLGHHTVKFGADAITFHRREKLPLHPNGMRLTLPADVTRAISPYLDGRSFAASELHGVLNPLDVDAEFIVRTLVEVEVLQVMGQV